MRKWSPQRSVQSLKEKRGLSKGAIRPLKNKSGILRAPYYRPRCYQHSDPNRFPCLARMLASFSFFFFFFFFYVCRVTVDLQVPSSYWTFIKFPLQPSGALDESALLTSQYWSVLPPSSRRFSFCLFFHNSDSAMEASCCYLMPYHFPYRYRC